MMAVEEKSGLSFFSRDLEIYVANFTAMHSVNVKVFHSKPQMSTSWSHEKKS